MNRPNTANNMKLSRTRSASRSSRIRWSTSLTTMRNLHKAKRPIQWDWINLPICDQKNVSAAVHWRNRAQTKTICSSQTNDQRNRNLSDLFFMFFVDIIYLCCCDMNRQHDSAVIAIVFTQSSWLKIIIIIKNKNSFILDGFFITVFTNSNLRFEPGR